MDYSARTGLWIIATGVVIAGLYWLREPLTQLALALILWLAIDGFADTLRKRIKVMPRFVALPLAIVIILSLAAVIGFVVVRNLTVMLSNLEGYQTRLDEILAQAYAAMRISGPPPTVSDVISRLDPTRVAQEIGVALQSLASDVMFTLIFLAFLFPAAAIMPKKIDRIFRDSVRRERTRQVLARIRTSMEQYMLVQTVASLIITGLTYITLSIIGLQNALFWSFLIFFLNYIPTIGSIVGTILPTAVALVQFPTLGPVAAVALGVGVWQFVIGNFLQPRMTGESLNLSALVVLLALAIWGAVFGIVGAFLAAPITVMLMIVLAQFPSTRWIAILLSADGKPLPRHREPNPPTPA